MMGQSPGPGGGGCSVAEDPQDHREWQKLLFDFYKHFTTLSLAAALVLLAIYQEDVLKEKVLVGVAVCFAISTLLSLFGLLFTLTAFPILPRPSLFRASVMPLFVLGIFGAGVVTVLAQVAHLPLKYVIIGSVALSVVSFLYFIVTYLKSRRL
jgi:hypothetical protein